MDAWSYRGVSQMFVYFASLHGAGIDFMSPLTELLVFYLLSASESPNLCTLASLFVVFPPFLYCGRWSLIEFDKPQRLAEGIIEMETHVTAVDKKNPGLCVKTGKKFLVDCRGEDGFAAFIMKGYLKLGLFAFWGASRFFGSFSLFTTLYCY